MYIPSIFREDRPEQLAELMAKYPLATLVTTTCHGLMANHIPLLYEPGPTASNPDAAPPNASGSNALGILHGHMARANPQWQDIQSKAEALVIFQGPDAYITPLWYATRQQSGRVVPTWNYAAVHAYGTIETYSEPDRLRRHLELLTATHEARYSPPWSPNDAPQVFIESLMQTIVGIDIHVTRFEGKCKVSQNRSADDRAGVVQGLLSQGDAQSTEMAHLICDHAPKPTT